MRYAEYSPPPNLATLVERFWLLEGAAQSTGGSADAVIPDGRVELIFHYGGSFWRHDDGGAEEQPAALLVGQMVAPVVLAAEGPAGVAAIRLRPAAAPGRPSPTASPPTPGSFPHRSRGSRRWPGARRDA